MRYKSSAWLRREAQLSAPPPSAIGTVREYNGACSRTTTAERLGLVGCARSSRASIGNKSRFQLPTEHSSIWDLTPPAKTARGAAP